MTLHRLSWRDRRFPEVVVSHAAEPVPRWIFEPADGENGEAKNGERAGDLIFLHGLCEHAYRFFPFAKQLAARGIRVHLPHQPGHGDDDAIQPDHPLARAYFEADGPAETLRAVGRFSPEDSDRYRRRRAENLAAQRTLDLAPAVTLVERLVEGLEAHGPVVIGGHSLGGLVTILAGHELGAARLTGVVALAPGLRPRSSPRGGILERWAVSALWTVARTPFLAPVHAGIGGLARWGPAVNVEWASAEISDLEAESTLHAEDPLIGDTVPLAFLSRIEAGMVAAHRSASSYGELATGSTTPGGRASGLPVGLFAAADDRVVDSRGSREFGSALPAHEQHRVEIVEGFAPHDPLRSTRAEEATAFIAEFTLSCLRRSPRQSP